MVLKYTKDSNSRLFLDDITTSCKGMNEICYNCGNLNRCHQTNELFCDKNRTFKFKSFKNRLYVTR